MMSRHHPLSTARIGAGVSVVVSIAIVMAMFGLMPSVPVHAAGVIYVKPGGAGLRDGSSWGNARDLAPALDAAASGDELWVAAGTYKPTTSDADPRIATFLLKNGVAIYGGFAGSESTRDARNWTQHVVILSGDIGLPNKYTDNCYHVVTGTSGATLNGVTISDGNADGYGGSAPVGGGMYNLASNPTLANVTFRLNSAARGGGMYNENNSPELTNVIFNGNTASEGGGFYTTNGDPKLTNVVFNSNITEIHNGDGSGAGMYNLNGSPKLTNVTFIDNHAVTSGGGMHSMYGGYPILTNVIFTGNSAENGGGMASIASDPTLTDVIISGNSATGNGGGMFNNSQSNATLNNVTISGNSAIGSGGGMYNASFTYPVLTNVVISGNQASDSGGGIYDIFYSEPTLNNVTISGNKAVTGSGGGIYSDNSNAWVTNTIIWGNTAPTNAGIVFITGVFDASYSLVQGSGGAGTGNLDVNPQFVTPVPSTPGNGGNLRLQDGSPAINAGINTPSIGVATDRDGQTRIVGAKVDLGAYERQPSGRRYVNFAATGTGSGYSWGNAITTLQDALAFASSGDELWVAKGTYKPGTSRSDTFQLRASVAVYGGFAGTEDTRNARNWTINPVILSGDIGTDKVYHVVTGAAGATLDGVTITGGNANGVDPDSKGGGIYNSANNLTLSNLIVTSNSAGQGGGIFNDSGTSTLTNAVISGNSAEWSGGIFNYYSDSLLTNVIISGNSASTYCGGIYNNYSSPTLTNVVISGNSGADGGGGMFNDYATPTLTHVSFSGNRAAEGGAMYNYYSNPIIRNSILWGNSATTSNPTIHNLSSTPQVSYSLVQGSGGSGADGNLDANPLFIGAVPVAPSTGGNLRLQSSSPAINHGSNILLPGGLASDIVGNPRIIGGIVDMGAYEVQNPSLVSITRAGSINPTNDASVIFNVKFNMPVTGVEAADFVLTTTGGQSDATIDTSSSSGSTWTVAVNTVDNQLGTIRLDLKGNNGISSSDAPQMPISGTGSTGFTAGDAYSLDRVRPETTVSSNRPNPTKETNATFSFSGSDSSGISGYECQIDDGGFSTCTSPYPTSNSLSNGSHTFQARAIDNVGNVDASPASYTWVVDTVLPAIGIGAPSASLTRGGPVKFVVSYSDDHMGTISLKASDITLNTTGTAIGTLSVSGSGTISRTVTISSITGDGTLAISLGADTATDAAGNSALAAGPSNFVTVDNTRPTVIVSSAISDPTNLSAILVTVAFSEDVVGFNATNITPVHASISNFTSISAQEYSFNLNPTALPNQQAEEVTAAITASVVTDAAGNPNIAAATFSRIYDNSPLAMSLTSTAKDYAPSSTIPVSVNFGKPVNDFNAADVAPVNASLGNFTAISSTSYTFTLTFMDNTKPVTVTIQAGAAHDVFSNPSSERALSWIYDNQAPSGLSLVASDPPAINTTSFQFTVVLSDNLKLDQFSLGDGDVTVTTPQGQTIAASLVGGSIYEQADKTVQVTFSIPAPGGTWEVHDNGIYTVKLAPNAVYDQAGNAAAAKNLGTFIVDLRCSVFLPIVRK